jgi:hypothetical protein
VPLVLIALVLCFFYMIFFITKDGNSLKNYTFFGCRYPINHTLKENDKSRLMMALHFHPRRDEKFGTGAEDIEDIKVYKIV